MVFQHNRTAPDSRYKAPEPDQLAELLATDLEKQDSETSDKQGGDRHSEVTDYDDRYSEVQSSDDRHSKVNRYDDRHSEVQHYDDRHSEDPRYDIQPRSRNPNWLGKNRPPGGLVLSYG